MGELHARAGDAVDVIEKLADKFRANLGQSLGLSYDELGAAELRARACAQVRRILREIAGLTPTQREITCMFDEIFGDIICSLYFAGCALDRPAQMVLRRALDLGLATVYLWDLPHAFWGWKMHDEDLRFNEMVDHLGSEAYLSYVRVTNPGCDAPEVLDGTTAKRVYRDLSNSVHGKLATFETALPDRFTHSAGDWQGHLALVNGVEDLLLDLWKNRFGEVERGLARTMPQLGKIS